jgi:radical SAM enzyme (TIGR01210 family)
MPASPAIPDLVATPYPDRPSERDEWILAHRPQRNVLDPFRPYAHFLEEEPSPSGEIVPVATILLTNRECPWRCAMCDLWRNTLASPTPPGAIPAQIDFALTELSTTASAQQKSCHPERTAQREVEGAAFSFARALKLYNAGSFFDPRAIPPADYPAIAGRIRSFERIIVECHPALMGYNVLRFRDLLDGAQLEVAMGLETAHPGILEKLNKRLTLGLFQSAADFLRAHSIDLRVFILVQPPFMDPSESLDWAERSLDFAFDCGATAATLIPTRGGNGAMEALAGSGDFTPPGLAPLEAAVSYGLNLRRGRVFTDLWDLPRPIDCPSCRDARITRLRTMNRLQAAAPPVACASCGGSA